MKNKKDFVENLDILDGIITYNDFDINENVAFEEQKYSFKEDILQIKFGDRFLLDVGWYPEMNPKGAFTVVAIQDYDWDEPVVKIKCRTLKTLKKAIEKAAKIIGDQKQIKNLPFRNIEY
jgi:hypothetical protein